MPFGLTATVLIFCAVSLPKIPGVLISFLACCKDCEKLDLSLLYDLSRPLFETLGIIKLPIPIPADFYEVPVLILPTFWLHFTFEIIIDGS